MNLANTSNPFWVIKADGCFQVTRQDNRVLRAPLEEGPPISMKKPLKASKKRHRSALNTAKLKAYVSPWYPMFVLTIKRLHQPLTSSVIDRKSVV